MPGCAGAVRGLWPQGSAALPSSAAQGLPRPPLGRQRPRCPPGHSSRLSPTPSAFCRERVHGRDTALLCLPVPALAGHRPGPTKGNKHWGAPSPPASTRVPPPPSALPAPAPGEHQHGPRDRVRASGAGCTGETWTAPVAAPVGSPVPGPPTPATPQQPRAAEVRPQVPTAAPPHTSVTPLERDRCSRITLQRDGPCPPSQHPSEHPVRLLRGERWWSLGTVGTTSPQLTVSASAAWCSHRPPPRPTTGRCWCCPLTRPARGGRAFGTPGGAGAAGTGRRQPGCRFVRRAQWGTSRGRGQGDGCRCRG